MKKLIPIVGALMLFSLSMGQQYKLNEKESIISWTGYGEIGGYRQSGEIQFQEAALTISDKKIVNGTATIDMTSLSSENKDLTKHLKNEDFFHVKNHPVAKLNFLRQEGKALVCELEMKGVLQVVEFAIEQNFNEERIILQGTATIDRTAFGITYNSTSFFKILSDNAIKNEFDVQFDAVFELNQ